VSTSVPPPGHVPPPGASPIAPGTAPAPGGAQGRGLRSRKLIGASLALLAAVAAVLVVFGLSGSPGVDPIAQAANLSARAPGYKMNLTFVVTSPQLNGPISGYASALVDPPDHAVSMSLAMDLSQVPQAAQLLGGSSLQLAMLIEGKKAYVKFPAALLSSLPVLGSKPWIEINAAKATGLPGFSSVGEDTAMSDPTQVLKELRTGADSVTDEGRQVIDGVQTTHYQAEVNLARLIPSVPSSALKQLTPQGQDVPVDVWIDTHDLVRRVQTSLSLGAPNQPSVHETDTADLSDYGRQTPPTPPPADQVTSLSNLGSILPG
jgi:hypothetical protein